MTLTRRRLVRLALIAPLGFAIVRAAEGAGSAVSSAAAALRPPAAGSSSSRCAMCGATGHAMLDPRCPAARKVV